MLGIVALILCVAALILTIVGVAIPYWYYVEGAKTIIGTVSYHFGLWRSCAATVCVDFTSTSDQMKGAQALEIIGILLLIGAVVCIVLKLFVMKDKLMLPKLAACFALSAGVLVIIGAIVFVTDDVVKLIAKIQNMDLHAGFGLTIVAAIVAIVAGIVTYVSARET